MRETRGAGGRGDGLWERRFRPELGCKVQHATPPFRWKGAADLKREALCRQLPARFWRLEAAGIGSKGFVGSLE